VKLPIGVADLDSLGAVVIPCEPTKAGTAGPTRAHPCGCLRQACSRAVVCCRELATTVTTSVAEPVE
jgi:hypothetical protein